jgi:hypothetical protein
VARLEELGVPMIPDFVVDDYPEIVTAFGGFIVSEYFIQQPADQETYDVYHTICEHARHGGLQTITEIVLAQHRLDERTQERAAYWPVTGPGPRR